MGVGYVRVSDALVKEFFTEGIRTPFEITAGIPDDAILRGVHMELFEPGVVRFWFEHNSIGDDEEIVIEFKKYYRGQVEGWVKD
jgi:hypothetical protein